MNKPEKILPVAERAAEHIGPPETIFERFCGVLCALAIVGMVVLTCAEVVSRTLRGHSLGFADEIGGYLLAAITFLSLPVALVHGSLHYVDFVQKVLSPFWRQVSHIVFLVLALAFALLMEWQLIRLVSRSFTDGVLAPTLLATPVWIPQSAMAIGMGLFALALLRSLLLRLSGAKSSNWSRTDHARMA